MFRGASESVRATGFVGTLNLKRRPNSGVSFPELRRLRWTQVGLAFPARWNYKLLCLPETTFVLAHCTVDSIDFALPALSHIVSQFSTAHSG